MSDSPKTHDLRIWWIPQVPGKPFHIDVTSVEDAIRIVDIMAKYDKFQFDNKIKPDYFNIFGLEIYTGSEWEEWYNKEDEDLVEIMCRQAHEEYTGKKD